MAPNKKMTESKWDSLIFKWMRDLDMGEMVHISFAVEKTDDDDEDGDEEVDSPDPIPVYRLN
jgi:hypothetical protein